MATSSTNITRPQGWSDRSYYLPMQDGVRLAVSLWFPERTVPTKPCPAILMLTRYGRTIAATRPGPRSINHWLTAGYVGCAVDVRGTTSSFGSRSSELGPEEQRDAREVIAHIAAQPWCNGKVITTGTSYSGTTADMVTALDTPALVAAVPCAPDFDFWEVFWPGGIPNQALLHEWAQSTYDIDFGRPLVFGGKPIYEPKQHASLDGRKRLEDCLKQFPTLQPVDEDVDCSVLQKALHSREDSQKRWTSDDYSTVSFRDDHGTNGHSFFESCPACQVPALIQQNKPVQYWVSWMDASTAEQAISRSVSVLNAPSVIVITGNNHVGYRRVDPHLPEKLDPLPSLEEQSQGQLRFAEEVMNGRALSRKIRYYVLGTDLFRESPTWPPSDSIDTDFWLSDGGRLVSHDPVTGVDNYEVDQSATSGMANRWHQLGTPAYGDRRLEDEKLLYYDTAPMEYDVEVAGWPVLTMYMSAQTEDPSLFAYLEDVSPGGRVTYITEGLLRLINRKLAPAHTLPYDQGPAPHSLDRRDALPVVAGEKLTIALKMFAIAALIKKGHRLRLAIAGADADTFRANVPVGKEERFNVYRGGLEASKLCVPLRSAELETTGATVK